MCSDMSVFGGALLWVFFCSHPSLCLFQDLDASLPLSHCAGQGPQTFVFYRNPMRDGRRTMTPFCLLIYASYVRMA